jgi:hypothetical protein
MHTKKRRCLSYLVKGEFYACLKKILKCHFYIKGIVSRDWGRLQMVVLDRSEVPLIPVEICF